MINIKTLVPQLQKQVAFLTEDLLVQSKSIASIEAFLRENYEMVLETGRLSQSYEEWSEDYLEQVAVSWILACVFVRFLEDNNLIDECWIAGEGDRGKLADGSYEIYFRGHPHESDREYLKFVFREVGKIPATRELFDDKRTPLWAVDPSGDAARRLLLFFKEIDAERGGLKRLFDTREVRTEPLVHVYQELAPQAQFLGDLYQDLSEHARKKYALLQTPEFVQQFILDRTLNPAISAFGLKGLRIIDPACGSGHFLLGAFDRLFALWMKSDEIRGNPVVAAQNAFDSIFGVDINPFAVAITRFRMLVAAVRACGVNRLHQQSYAWKLNLAVGDSLLRGSRSTFGGRRSRILIQQELEFEPAQELRIEDPAEANRILDQGYHVVVGNPPYIIVRDRAQNAAYRQIYSTCHQKYSLGVPFTQRFRDLTIRKGERINDNTDVLSHSDGFNGMITANSFMKRGFGKKLIEDFFPKSGLTHVIDTSGAHIPGHGTPTVILLHCPDQFDALKVRAVFGIKGEPGKPEDASQGLVWRSIVRQIDNPGAHDEYTSTADVARTTFNIHPWSIGGGGASEIMEVIEDNTERKLGEESEVIGVFGMTNCDDVFFSEASVLIRQGVESVFFRPMLTGDDLRDWSGVPFSSSIFPYDSNGKLLDLSEIGKSVRILWPYRITLGNRITFSKDTYFSENLPWWKWHQISAKRMQTSLTITFAFVATHNHFVLDRGGNVFNRHAPIIKLLPDSSDDDYLALLGLLNSSTACFWMKQTLHDKGGGGIGGGIATEFWEHFFEFTGTGLLRFPTPEERPLYLARLLDRLSQDYNALLPDAIVERGLAMRTSLEEAKVTAAGIRGHMIALQEELDWQCYRFYGLLGDDLQDEGIDLPELKLGERAFEIVMARQIAKGELQTAWFERHGSTPITEIPEYWPTAYRTLVHRRIQVMETNKEIGLIERPEYKRRWNTESWEVQEQRALKGWLLDRLESSQYWPSVELQSTARLSDRASGDADFLQVAAMYRGRPDFDVTALVAELVEAESVPFLPVLRYKPTALRKRAVWERTWDLQRKQDGGEDVGEIPVPPKYATLDFVKNDYGRLRGKLDVPKERWISYPYLQTESDPTMLVGWAGWDHLQQATALVAYYEARKREGWEGKRLTPILSGLDQLLPWIHQWHPEIDPEFGDTAGQSYQALLENDAHELGLTLEDVRNWQPPEKARKSRTTGKKKATAEDDE